MGLMVNGNGLSFGNDKNVLKLDNGHSCTTLWIYLKTTGCTIEKGDFYGI